MKKYVSIALTLFSVVFYACQEDTPDNPADDLAQQQLDSIENFLEANNISATEDERLFYYRALTENANGASPEVGDIVNFYCTISTLDGQLIDERKEGEDDFAKVALGNGVIKVPIALEAAIALMREGEQYEFYLPSLRAYQDFSKPGLIPENAIIKMQIQIVEVLSPAEEKIAEDEQIQSYITQQGLTGAQKLDSGVYYIQTEAGSGGEEAANGKTLEVRYEGVFLDGTAFDDNLDKDSPYSVTIGANEVIPGFEIGLQQMQAGEKGIILIPSHAAYGASATILPRSIIGDLLSSNRIDPRLDFTEGIPPFAILQFNVEVEAVN